MRSRRTRGVPGQGYTMTSVGYGDIGPANALERIVCTVLVPCLQVAQ